MTQDKTTQKRVLVTGATGQDGSYMIDYLLEKTNHLVFGMIRRTAKPDYGNLSKSISNPRFKLVVGDLSDTTSIDNVVKEVKPDYFINLAAQSFVGSSWTTPEQTFDVDAIGVIRCLEAVRKHVPHCRFYSAGSSEQWGNVAYTPQDEAHPFRPRSPYGAAKCAAAHIVKVYRESYGLYAIHALLLNHESERRGEEFVTRKITLGVARIAKAIKEENFNFDPIELGNIDAKRDWSHAEDFVDGIWRMMNQDIYKKIKAIGHINVEAETKWLSRNQIEEYVLSSNETHTVREFIEKAFVVAGIQGVWWDSGFKGDPKDEQFLFSRDGVLATKRAIPLVKINPAFYRPADVELLLGNSNKARTELGWAPRVTFDELVKRMVVNDLKDQGIEI